MTTRTIRNTLLAAALATGLGLAGCQSSGPARVSHSAEADAAMLAPIAALEGEWLILDPEGNEAHGATFKHSSGGSIVREIMFPGHAHEMTNVYHMDGEKLVLTHYCAAGNQPRMVASEAERTAEGISYHFEFDSVSNLRPEHDHYMGTMTLTLLNDGRIREEWRSFHRDGSLTEPTTFVMWRRGS